MPSQYGLGSLLRCPEYNIDVGAMTRRLKVFQDVASRCLLRLGDLNAAEDRGLKQRLTIKWPEVCQMSRSKASVYCAQ